MEKLLIPINEELMAKIKRKANIQGVSPMVLILQILNKNL